MLSTREILSGVIREARVQEIEVRNGVRLDMLRLDEIHPVISGNKLFKLSFYLEEARQSTHKTIITFGGAYSNHLAATAFACNMLGLRSIGIVRGSRHEVNSATIANCSEWGMELHFIGRTEFKILSQDLRDETINARFGAGRVVPLGGYGIPGAKGAAEILRYISPNTYYYICVSVGTATTIAGLLLGSKTEKIIGFPALKGFSDMNIRLRSMNIRDTDRLIVCPDFHFGGFARRNEELITFMNSFYHNFHIPLDFVYTGKMMYGIYRLVDDNFFPPGSRILVMHTGGLQGNSSLPAGTLRY